MVFKMVTRNEKAAGRIAGNAMAHAQMIADEQLAKWQERLPEGQTDVGIGQLQRFHAEELRQLRAELRATERAHLDQQKEIALARARRDEIVPRLREELYAYRNLFEETYGETGRAKVFPGKKTNVPVDATPLRRVATTVVERLESPELELPEPIRQGVALSRPVIARAISRPLAELDAAMNALDTLLAAASATLEAKTKTLAAVKDKSKRLARFLEGVYGLGGHDVLAARVRPSSHQKKEQAEGSGVESGEPESAADQPATAQPATPPPADAQPAPAPAVADTAQKVPAALGAVGAFASQAGADGPGDRSSATRSAPVVRRSRSGPLR